MRKPKIKFFSQILPVLLPSPLWWKSKKKSKMWPLKRCSCIWADLKPFKAPFIPWKHDLRRRLIFSDIRKIAQRWSKCLGAIRKAFVFLICFNERQSRERSWASWTWETQVWRDLEEGGRGGGVCVRLVQEPAEVDEDVACAARAWLESEPWQLSTMAPAHQTSTTRPSPFWLEISVSFHLFHSWRDAEISLVL